MRIPGLSRRWLIAGAASLGVVLTATIGLAVVYPRVGAWMIRSKVGGKLAQRIGRDIRFGAIDVAIGRAVLRDVEVRGPLDGDTPLVHVDQIDVEFDGWRSLFGAVELGAARIDGVLVTIHRGADGQDNVRDVVDRLRAKGEGSGGGSGSLRPTSITVTHGKLLANDELTGATGLVADADARWTPDRLVAHARGVTATTLNAPKASAAAIEVERVAGTTPIVTIDGGEIALWPRLALSGIAGKVVANPRHAGEYVIDLAGGYGGVPGRLWTAKGALDPEALTASFDLEAAKFQLDRLAPILEHSAVVDYATTSVDTRLHLAIDRVGAKFSGSFHLTGLNVGHPLIAEHEVRGLDLSGQIAGSFERAGRRLELTQGDFVARNMPFSITGVVTAPHRAALAELAPVAPGQGGQGAKAGAAVPAATADKVAAADRPAATADKVATADKAGADRAGREPPRVGPHGIEVLQLRLVIPPIDCQRVLNAIPTEMAPYLAGYKVKGVFDTDVHVDIDWRDLDATQLDGSHRDQALQGRRRAGGLAQAAAGGVRAVRRGRAGRVGVVRRRAEQRRVRAARADLAVPRQVDHVDRGLGVLPAPRLHHERVPHRAGQQPQGRQVRPGRVVDHDADGQERAALSREDAGAKAPGAVPDLARREHADQGPDHGDLPQRDRVRPGAVRHRAGRATTSSARSPRT